MKPLSKLVFHFAIASFSLISCSDDDSDSGRPGGSNPVSDENTGSSQNLIGKSFALTGFEERYNGVLQKTYLDLRSCVKDDELHFTLDSMVVDYNTILCPSQNVNERKFGWELSADNKTLILTEDPNTIQSINLGINDGTLLQFKYEVLTSNTQTIDTISLVYTYSRI